jgi:Xaa-Pro aminopeptidase
MDNTPDLAELDKRLDRLFQALHGSGQDFDTAIIINKINQYYLTGTMQDGLLVLRRDGSIIYFVRKSYTRACLESPLRRIIQINSYRDMRACLPENLGHTWLETELVPLAMLDRIRKHFTMQAIIPLDGLMLQLRAVKSDNELAVVRESGRQHRQVLEQVVPGLLREGMSETDLFAEMYEAMVKLGHQGVSRFAMFQMEMVIGQAGFGTNSLYPTSFDGPGGMLGQHPAVPILGSRTRKLHRGDLVFVDVGYGYAGYHTDKTQVYSFGQEPSARVKAVHTACRSLLDRAAAGLVPGCIPDQLYRQLINDLPDELSTHFMGFQDPVRFLGHGVGLQIDENPVIAQGKYQPLEENMVVALEPKCGIEGVGMVGVEETFVVTSAGAQCLTGGARDIMVV